jgi:peptidoglycan-associated lipoprotein
MGRASGGGLMFRQIVSFAAVGLLVATIGVGCSAKKKDQDPTARGAEFGEEGLAPDGSLERHRAGTLGAEGEYGPLRDIFFAFDSDELDDEARAVLRENGNWLKEQPRTRVEIEGHCDERGTIEYNLALGAKRARAAKEYLIALGISPDRLSTISYGEELPVCYEHNEACWRKNRRCHFVVLGD